MNKIELAKESLKSSLQELLKTDLVVLNEPEVMYQGVVYCVLREIEVIPSDNYCRFKFFGNIQLTKNYNDTGLGLLTELIFSAKHNNKNGLSFFSEKLSNNIYSMDFIFISNKYNYNFEENQHNTKLIKEA